LFLLGAIAFILRDCLVLLGPVAFILRDCLVLLGPVAFIFGACCFYFKGLLVFIGASSLLLGPVAFILRPDHGSRPVSVPTWYLVTRSGHRR
jgi:hypothetical protein